MKNKETILHHYLHCALWTEELDYKFDIEHIAKFSVDQAKRDIELFVNKTEKLLDESELTEEQIGHDFWLTRNGHGSGFWDRDLGDIGTQLTATAKDFKTLNVFKEKKEVIIE